MCLGSENLGNFRLIEDSEFPEVAVGHERVTMPTQAQLEVAPNYTGSGNFVVDGVVP